jgi:hypothetical protein
VFAFISSSLGIIGFFVSIFRDFLCRQLHIISVQIQFFVSFLNKCLVILSSKEWKLITNIFHHFSSNLIASSKDFSRVFNSSFTSILIAWNILDLVLGNPCIISLSSFVVLNFLIFLCSTIFADILFDHGSSQYLRKIFLNSEAL